MTYLPPIPLETLTHMTSFSWLPGPFSTHGALEIPLEMAGYNSDICECLLRGNCHSKPTLTTRSAIRSSEVAQWVTALTVDLSSSPGPKRERNTSTSCTLTSTMYMCAYAHTYALHTHMHCIHRERLNKKISGNNFLLKCCESLQLYVTSVFKFKYNLGFLTWETNPTPLTPFLAPLPGGESSVGSSQTSFSRPCPLVTTFPQDRKAQHACPTCLSLQPPQP